jgi:hypothetical protein
MRQAFEIMVGATGLEPTTSGVTGRMKPSKNNDHSDP